MSVSISVSGTLAENCRGSRASGSGTIDCDRQKVGKLEMQTGLGHGTGQRDGDDAPLADSARAIVAGNTADNVTIKIGIPCVTMDGRTALRAIGR